MRLRACDRSLLAGVAAVLALAAGAGVAHADPQPGPPPPRIDQSGQPPTTFVNPSNEGQPTTDSGDVGMVCENLLVPCQ